MSLNYGLSPASDRVESISLWIASVISCSNFTPSRHSLPVKSQPVLNISFLRAKVKTDKGCGSNAVGEVARKVYSSQHEKLLFAFNIWTSYAL